MFSDEIIQTAKRLADEFDEAAEEVRACIREHHYKPTLSNALYRDRAKDHLADLQDGNKLARAILKAHGEDPRN